MPDPGNSGYVDFTASNHGGNQVLRVHWVETYDIATWTSTVTIDHVYFSTTSWTGYTYTASLEILVNGQSSLSITGSSGYRCAGADSTLTEILKSGASLTGSVSGIPHNADGTKTTTIVIRSSTGGYDYPGLWTSYTDYSNPGSPQTVGLPNPFTNNDSKSIQLYTIAAASTIAASNGQFGVAQNITISRQSSGVTHTITASCLGQTQTVATKTATYPTVSWTPPASWMDLIPNSQSASCTLTCKTYSGNTLVGTSTKTVTLTVTGVNPAPTISWVEVASPTHASKYGHLVQGQSKVAVTVTPGTKRSATVASLSSVVNNSTYYPASPAYTFTSSPLTKSGDNTITASVRDSRNLSGSGSTTISGVLAYSSPNLSSIGVHRCDSDLTPNDSGSYMYISYSAVITSLNSANSKTIAYRYRVVGGAWSAWSNEVTLASYSASGSLPDTGTAIDISTGVANGSAYEVAVRVKDDFGSVIRTTQLSTVPVTMDFNEYGDAVGFGVAPAFRKAVDIGSWTAIGRVFGLGQARAAVTTGADLDTYTEMGVYGVTDAVASTLSNKPTSVGGRLIVSQSIGGTSGPGETYQYVQQEYIDRYGDEYRRYGLSNNSTTVTWYAWQGVATKSALGLGSLISESKSAANSSSMAFTLANNEKGAIICSGVQSSAKEFIIFNCTSTGGVSAIKVGSASGISISTSTRTLTISNSSGSYAYGIKLSYIA